MYEPHLYYLVQYLENMAKEIEEQTRGSPNGEATIRVSSADAKFYSSSANAIHYLENQIAELNKNHD